jgi:glyoxylase-like metal-dependent hydrolase (beta-lactamase superfamily II)
MLVVKKFVFNLFSENTFIVWDEDTLESVIIDAGCSGETEEEKLVEYISEVDISVKYLITTHGHIDHVLGSRFVLDKYKPEYYGPQDDLPFMQRIEIQGAAFGIELDSVPIPEKYLSENLTLNLGKSVISFLYTPGHTPGEYCVYFKEAEFCITGDVLFKNSIGRTDLWGGDVKTILESIDKKLFTLPDNVIIYPGHGDSSKIGIEKSDNPFVNKLSKW